MKSTSRLLSNDSVRMANRLIPTCEVFIMEQNGKMCYNHMVVKRVHIKKDGLIKTEFSTHLHTEAACILLRVM
ncbi:MAG: hypothetical protein KIG43_04160 [Eubacteriales bacterium]|nr:hypothetical protein [Eubacteriales bacterium]